MRNITNLPMKSLEVWDYGTDFEWDAYGSLRARKGQIHLKRNISVFILVKFGAKYVSKISQLVPHPQQFILRVMFVYSNTEMHLLLRYFRSFSVSSWPL